MKRLITMLLVVAGALASPAVQAKHDRAEIETLPAPALEALESLAAAIQVTGDSVTQDLALADALRRCARGVESIPAADGVSFAAFVRLQSGLLQREIVDRMREGGLPDGGPLPFAFDELQSSKGDWIEAHLDAGADGPDSTCFQQLVQCYVYCSVLPSFVLRTACGLDCEVDFFRCMKGGKEDTGSIQHSGSLAVP